MKQYIINTRIFKYAKRVIHAHIFINSSLKYVTYFPCDAAKKMFQENPIARSCRDYFSSSAHNWPKYFMYIKQPRQTIPPRKICRAGVLWVMLLTASGARYLKGAQPASLAGDRETVYLNANNSWFNYILPPANLVALDNRGLSQTKKIESLIVSVQDGNVVARARFASSTLILSQDPSGTFNVLHRGPSAAEDRAFNLNVPLLARTRGSLHNVMWQLLIVVCADPAITNTQNTHFQ